MSALVLGALLLGFVPNTDTIQQARARYDVTRQRLELQRQHYAEAYALFPAQRPEILAAARREVELAFTDTLVPAWTRTPWSMSGRSDTPGRGHIACGIYVSTLMEHLGFSLDRVPVGQLASEHIARTLTSKRNMRRWSNKPARKVSDEIRAWGPGLYAVGLDYHAGLIWVDDNRTPWFVHSTVLSPTQAVVEHLLRPGNPFVDSRYRIVSRLLDDTMMKAWLHKKHLRTFHG